jgi:hypothetical protein
MDKNPNPGSRTSYTFFGLKILKIFGDPDSPGSEILSTLDPEYGIENLDPESGINITDPQH